MKVINNIALSITLISLMNSALAQNTPQGVSIANDQVPPSKNAMLDVVSTEKGVLIPRVTFATIDSTGTGILNPSNIVSGEDGLIVFVKDAGANYGFWYFDATVTKWRKLANTSSIPSSSPSLWVDNTAYPGNIYYSPAGANKGFVMINGNPSPTSPQEQANLTIYPLQVFTDYGNVMSNPIKIGGGITAFPENPSITTGHSNEINFDEGSLDFQFWNGQDVNIGSGVKGADLWVHGNIHYTGSLNPSDSTLKTNIRGLSGQQSGKELIQNLKQVKFYSYEFKSQPGELHYGVIAQELEKIFPTLVQQADLPISKDQMGKNITKPIKVVNYNALSVLSTEAVKTLITENEAQQKQIDAMRAELDKLVKRVEALEKK